MEEEQNEEVEVGREEEEPQLNERDEDEDEEEDVEHQRKRVKTLEEKVNLLERELRKSRRDNCKLRHMNRVIDGKMRRWMEVARNPVAGGVYEDNGRGEMVMPPEPMNALELFPMPVWGHIFSRVKDAQDLNSCYKATHAWYSALKPMRTTFLFPQVFLLLKKKRSFLPDRSDIFNLRLVCRTWKTVADKYLQHHECHFNLEEYCQQDDDHNCWRRRLRFCFVTSVGVEDFRTDVLQNYRGKNPIITRSLTIIDRHTSRLYESNQLWTSVIFLLYLMGNQIWYCNLRFLADQSVDILYTILYQCLSLMPNLLVLEISYNDNNQSTEAEIEMEHLLESHPLPNLPKLLVLITSQLPRQILNKCLGLSRKISKLQVETQSNSFPIEGPMLPKLVEFTLSINSAQDVAKLRRIPWHIHTLSLVVFVNKFNDLSYLFQNLYHFGASLKSLNIKFNNGAPTHEPSNSNGGDGVVAENRIPKLTLNTVGQNLRLYLPHLEKLRLHLANVELIDIDFILPLHNLYRLIIVFDNLDVTNDAGQVKPYPEDPDAIIQFFGMLDNLYASNIWKLCPYLRCIFLKLRTRRPTRWGFFRRFIYIRENYIDRDPDPE